MRRLKAEVSWQTGYGGDVATVYGVLEDVIAVVRLLMTEHADQDVKAIISGDPNYNG